MDGWYWTRVVPSVWSVTEEMAPFTPHSILLRLCLNMMEAWVSGLWLMNISGMSYIYSQPLVADFKRKLIDPGGKLKLRNWTSYGNFWRLSSSPQMHLKKCFDEGFYSTAIRYTLNFYLNSLILEIFIFVFCVCYFSVCLCLC